MLDGRLAVIYDNHILYSRSDQQRLSETATEVYLVGAQVAGRERDMVNTALTLRADEESLQLVLRRRGYRGTSSQALDYRLLPLDTIWRQTSGRRPLIYFPSLPKGDYVLEAKDAADQSASVRLVLSATLPWYRQPLTWVVATAVLAGLLGLGFRQNLLRQQREARRASELKGSQLSALAAQMNPHFMFNALNSVQDFVLANDKLAANRYLTSFAHMMRLTLDHSQRSHITLREELDAVTTYLELERVRFDDEIKVVLEVDPDLPLAAELPADARATLPGECV